MRQYFYSNGNKTYKRELRSVWNEVLVTDSGAGIVTVRVIPGDDSRGWKPKVQLKVQYSSGYPAYVMLSCHEVEKLISTLGIAMDTAKNTEDVSDKTIDEIEEEGETIPEVRDNGYE